MQETWNATEIYSPVPEPGGGCVSVRDEVRWVLACSGRLLPSSWPCVVPPRVASRNRDRFFAGLVRKEFLCAGTWDLFRQYCQLVWFCTWFFGFISKKIEQCWKNLVLHRVEHIILCNSGKHPLKLIFSANRLIPRLNVNCRQDKCQTPKQHRKVSLFETSDGKFYFSALKLILN